MRTAFPSRAEFIRIPLDNLRYISHILVMNRHKLVVKLRGHCRDQRDAG